MISQGGRTARRKAHNLEIVGATPTPARNILDFIIIYDYEYLYV